MPERRKSHSPRTVAVTIPFANPGPAITKSYGRVADHPDRNQVERSFAAALDSLLSRMPANRILDTFAALGSGRDGIGRLPFLRKRDHYKGKDV